MLFHRSLLFDQIFFSNIDSNDDGSFLHYEWKKNIKMICQKQKLKDVYLNMKVEKKNYKNEILCYIKKKINILKIKIFRK